MSQRILVIDDEIEFTHMVKLLLQMSGAYQVREHHTARAALETARQFEPDLILLDCMMPEMDGGEVASKFDADPVLSKIPIIFLTATVTEPEVQTSHCYRGERMYLPKPLQLGKLVETIERTLAAKHKATREAAEGVAAAAQP